MEKINELNQEFQKVQKRINRVDSGRNFRTPNDPALAHQKGIAKGLEKAIYITSKINNDAN